MKPAAICPPEVSLPQGSDPDSRRNRDPVRRALGLPARYWLRLGERLFHYQLLRAQMLERAFLPRDRNGDSR